MKLVPISVEALGPLAFPERKPGVQFRTSLPYVPGAAIYGALGMLLGEEWEGTAEEFAALFRAIRCHNAYPALEGDPWVHPLPMTALQPKGGKSDSQRCPGNDSKLGRIRHPYDDSLYARVCWGQQKPAALIYAPADPEGRPWEAAGRAFYTLEDCQCQAWRQSDDLATATLATREVSQRVLTRVSINRRRGTAEDQRLYSPLVIDEVMEDRDKKPVQTRFLGSIAVPDRDTHILAALQDVTHIGGRQTTGIGAIQIVRRQEAALDDERERLEGRVACMTQRFHDQAGLYTGLGGSSWQEGTIFTVDLLSDAILLDRGWLPTNELNGDMLAEFTRTFTATGAIDYPGITARLLRSFTATTTVGGWNVSWQRPKPTAVATAMGSVFVFLAENGLQPRDFEALARLQHGGIGERRAEGYGQVRVCDEFHLLSTEES